MDEISVLSSRSAYADRQGTYNRISHGYGPYLFDHSGRRFLDASGGSGSTILGHGDRQIAALLAEQATKLTVFPGRYMSYELVERYAQRLISFATSSINRAIIYSSGSDAVEASIKLAIQYHRASNSPRKTKIIGRHASYHGNTLAGLAAGGFIRRREPYLSVLTDLSKAAPAHCPDCFFKLTPQTCALECAASVEQAILAEGPETVAAFIAEPIVGAALSGAVPDARYFAKVRQICDRHDVLLIADEVMSGFGRTGLHFAVEHWNIEPDIIATGKAMSAGYFPISALLVHQRVSAQLEETNQPFQNGHTHACSPLASAVGLHVLDRIEADGLMENAHVRGAEILEALGEMSENGWIANPRGLGLMIGFDLLDARTRISGTRPGLADLFHRLALAHGLIVYPSTGSACSNTGEHVLLLPPLNIDAQHTRVIIDAISKAQRDLESVLDTPAQ